MSLGCSLIHTGSGYLFYGVFMCQCLAAAPTSPAQLCSGTQTDPRGPSGISRSLHPLCGDPSPGKGLSWAVPGSVVGWMLRFLLWFLDPSPGKGGTAKAVGRDQARMESHWHLKGGSV